MAQDLFRMLQGGGQPPQQRRPIAMAAPMQFGQAAVAPQQSPEAKPLPTWEEIKAGWGMGGTKAAATPGDYPASPDGETGISVGDAAAGKAAGGAAGVAEKAAGFFGA